MAHSHAHSHGPTTNDYIEQIVTIAVCGALAGVCIVLYVNGGLGDKMMLTPDQHLRVFFGGLGLLVLVLARAAYVWIAAGRTAGKSLAETHDHHEHKHAHGDGGHHHHEEAKATPVKAHNHDHACCDHDHDHGHDHGPVPEGGYEHFHDHGHDHDHSHGAAPWRYALLVLPVVLFIFGLPRSGGAHATQGIDAEVQGVQATASKGQNFRIGFNQLELAAKNPEVRESIAGTTIRLTGQFVPRGPNSFTLARFKINCCAADRIQLNALIMVDPAKTNEVRVDPAKYPASQWVEVTGQLQFSTVINRDNTRSIIPVVLLEPESQKQLEEELIKVVPPPRDPNAND